MQDTSKTLPKSFRITEETAEKFKEIAQSLDSNQEQTLAKLIEVYEIEMGRTSIPEARENIDTFEGYVRAALSMYMQSLESNKNMRALVHTEFEAQLRSKDQTIQELQIRVENAEMAAKNASENEAKLQESIDELERSNESLQEQRKSDREAFDLSFAENESQFQKLNEKFFKLQASEEEVRRSLSSFMKENETLKEENRKNVGEIKDKEDKISKHREKISSLEVELERVRAAETERYNRQKEDFEQYKKVCDMEHLLKMQTRENELKDKHKEEMDAIRKELDKYKELYYKNKNENQR